jgi:hypothetical protein
VHIVGTGRAVRTDAAGRWRLNEPPAGARVLGARLLGWVPVSMAIDVRSDVVDTIPLVMRRFPRTLSTVEVRARTEQLDRDAALLAERLMQLRVGTGRLFTREEILRLKPFSVVDLVRGVVGVDIKQTSQGITAVTKRAGTGAMQVQGEGCPLQFYLDGRAVDNEVIASLSPMQWKSVEVHPQTTLLTGLPSNSGKCGAIVINSLWR